MGYNQFLIFNIKGKLIKKIWIKTR